MDAGGGPSKSILLEVNMQNVIVEMGNDLVLVALYIGVALFVLRKFLKG